MVDPIVQKNPHVPGPDFTANLRKPRNVFERVLQLVVAEEACAIQAGNCKDMRQFIASMTAEQYDKVLHWIDEAYGDNDHKVEMGDLMKFLSSKRQTAHSDYLMHMTIRNEIEDKLGNPAHLDYLYGLQVFFD